MNSEDKNKVETPEENETAQVDENCIEDDVASKLQCQLDELNDKYQRLAAEYDNYRKRSQKEKVAAFSDAYAEAWLSILPVIDNIERAAEFAKDDSEVSKGIQMLKTQSIELMAKAGIEEIKSLGEQFDPTLHNAIAHNEDEETKPNTITQVFLKGYKREDKVIRHALVAVTN